jgi:catechol 2,3-dioxygenase-like lactoylglutathione lyase family enzyme
MQLSYLYVSVPDLQQALTFYRDQLGFEESWREGEGTVAFKVPGSSVELMIDVPPDTEERWATGPFFEVDDVAAFIREHQTFAWVGEPIDMPGGRTASFRDPAGNLMHVFDQSDTPT